MNSLSIQDLVILSFPQIILLLIWDVRPHYLVRNFYESESFINVCVQVKIIYLIHMDMEADQNSNGEESMSSGQETQ